jgi:NADH:ubiquinone oxidoreductase subunit 2 (subunit N)
MYLKKETTGSEPTMSPGLAFTVAVAVIATLALGVYPRLLFEAAERSAQSLTIGGISAAIR